MALLGSATLIDARAGRQLNNALTLTFKLSKDEMLGVATQASGIGVLLGFRNGGSGRYTLKAAGGTLGIDAKPAATGVTLEGTSVGSIDAAEGGSAPLRDSSGAVVAHLVGQPAAQKAESAWTYPVVDAAGVRLGAITLFRTSFDLAGEALDLAIWWDKAGGPLKVPTLGARLRLDAPVAGVLGDLLLAACVDLALGPRSFLAP